MSEGAYNQCSFRSYGKRIQLVLRTVSSTWRCGAVLLELNGFTKSLK